MDSLKEIFGVTRERPEVNHEFKKITWSAPHVVTKAASRNSDHTFDNCLTVLFSPFFPFFWQTDWALHWHTLGEQRTPVYTFQMTSLWQHYTRHLVWWPTQYHLQCWTTEQLHKFPKKKTQPTCLHKGLNEQCSTSANIL